MRGRRDYMAWNDDEGMRIRRLVSTSSINLY